MMLTREDGRHIIKTTCKGINIMTPDVIEYGNIGPLIGYELTRGKGFRSEKIYGLTVRALHPDSTVDDRYDHLGGLYWDLPTVRKHIKTLTTKYGRG